MAAVAQRSAAVERSGTRTILLVDAATCAVAGLVAGIGATPVGDVLDVTRGWVLGTGVFLVVYAAGLWACARGSDTVARQGAAVTAVGDALWVLASVALVVTSTFSAAGNAIVLAVAAVVAAIGATKARLLSGQAASRS